MRRQARLRALGALAAFAALAFSAGAGGATNVAAGRRLGLAAGGPPARLVAVSTRATGSVTSVLIEASEPVPYVTTQPDPRTLLIELRNVTVRGAQNRANAVRGGVISAVQVEEAEAFDGLPLARVRVSLNAPATHRVQSSRNTIRLEFQRAAGDEAAGNGRASLPLSADPGAALAPPASHFVAGVESAGAPAEAGHHGVAGGGASLQAGPAAEPAPQQVPPEPAPQAPAPPTQTTAAAPNGERQYKGHLVTLDFQNVDLRAVLRTFSEISGGINIVIDPAVQGTVDVSLRDVPWDQALDIILRANQLGYSVEGTIIRIAPLKVLAVEQEDRRKLAEAQALSGELRVLTKTLSYAKAADMAALITRSALSSRGTVEVDPRTNTLIIRDLPDRLEAANALLSGLDRAEPQVEIEARIVQTTREFARSLGVQWGVTGRVASDLGNTTPLAFPNRGGVTGRTGGTQTPNDPRATPFETSSTAINLAAANATSAIGVALGAVNGALNLDIALSALERSGRGRVLSSPRVSTMNNNEAEVTQGVEIPIQTVANNTVTVTFKQAALSLKVTPQITSANTVIMKIVLENASPDFSRSVNGIPPIDTQRANTQVQVNDGATTVIGGIFVSREQSANDRTPALHRIPLLGWLFKRDTLQDESRELLIFITPRIIK